MFAKNMTDAMVALNNGSMLTSRSVQKYQNEITPYTAKDMPCKKHNVFVKSNFLSIRCSCSPIMVNNYLLHANVPLDQ